MTSHMYILCVYIYIYVFIATRDYYIIYCVLGPHKPTTLFPYESKATTSIRPVHPNYFCPASIHSTCSIWCCRPHPQRSYLIHLLNLNCSE